MKIHKISILLILIFGLLATAAYAKSFTDVMGESLDLIDDFFRNEGYKPYSLAIDLFVFFAVFLAIYMRGIKFAFKEITKTEKGLAIVLAFTTAFLLVIGDYSIVKLLPFLQYFLFFLLLALMWWLLKDMKSKWLRFLLALLLTLLLLLLFFGLFSATSYRIGCPESGLSWLPWLLALLLFILFWFLLKDIKNAFGRFLLALLITIAVVLLILFLLKTFSKELGCPEGSFATSLLGDVGDSFKLMDIGSFGGFGLGGPLLPELSKIAPPDQKKEEVGKTVDDKGLAVGETPKPKRPLEDLSEEEIKRRMSEITFSADRARLQEELDTRSKQRREKAAENVGLIFGVPKSDNTLEQYERELLNQKGKHKDSTYYVERDKDNKVVLKRGRWWWSDPTIDPETDEDLKGTLKAKKGEYKEEREKTADSLGLFFGVPSQGKTLFQREEEILAKGKKEGADKHPYYTERGQEGKLILKRDEWFTDPVVTEAEPGVKSIIEQERAKQKPPVPARAPPTTEPATPPPATGTTPPVLSPEGKTPPPETTTKAPPTQKAPPAAPSSAKPPERKGLSIGLLGIVALLTLALGAGAIWGARRGRIKHPKFPDMFGEGGFVGSPIDRIAQAIKKFDGIIALIESTQNEKDKFVMLGENREKLLEGLEKSSAANLWTDKGRKIIREENPILHELLALEEKLRGHLFELRTAENLFLKDLDSWQRIVPQDYHNYLKNLASKDAKPSEFKKMGIIQLASVCDAFEKQDEASIKELDALMKERNIAVLVRGKFKTVKADWDRLKKYNTHENVILSIIIGKIKEQKGALIKLEKEISKPGGNPEGSRNREDEKSQNSNPLERELAQKKAK